MACFGSTGDLFRSTPDTAYSRQDPDLIAGGGTTIGAAVPLPSRCMACFQCRCAACAFGRIDLLAIERGLHVVNVDVFAYLNVLGSDADRQSVLHDTIIDGVGTRGEFVSLRNLFHDRQGDATDRNLRSARKWPQRDRNAIQCVDAQHLRHGNDDRQSATLPTGALKGAVFG